MKNSWASESLPGLFIKILPGQASARGVFTREEKNERPKSPPQVEVVVADKVFEQAQEREVNAMRGRASWRRRKKLVTACDVSGLSSARHQLCPRSVMSHSNDPADQSPEHWRQLARQAASHANMSSDPEVRDALNAIAEEYIVLADKAEAKAKASDGPSESDGS